MLLIESVKTKEVVGDECQVVIGRPSISAYSDYSNLPTEEKTIKTELVRGNRFYDIHGNEVCIGMTKEVQDVLKLPFDVYYNMSNAVNSIDRELDLQKSITHRLQYRLETIKKMSFWERLSRVFVGFSTLNLK